MAKKDKKKTVKKVEETVEPEVVEEEVVEETEEPTEEEIVIKEITEEKKSKNIFKRLKGKKLNKKDVVIFVVAFIIGIAISCLFINRVPKVKNGEEVLVSLTNNSYTATDVYEEMKTSYGLTTVLRKIDLDLVKAYYDGAKDEEAKSSAEEQAESYISQYTAYGYDEATFLSYYGFSDKQAFIDYLEEDYLLNQYYNDYVKTTITDDEVQAYYDQYATGKKTVYMFSESDGTTNLKAIKKLLASGTKISKVVSKYEDVTGVTVNSKLDIDISSISSYSDTVASYMKSTEAKSYSKIFSDDSLGNVLIYVSSSEETPTLEDSKDDILTALATEAENADSNLYYVSFINLRNKNKIKFYDKVLKSQYSEYVAKYTGTDETTESTTAAE